MTLIVDIRHRLDGDDIPDRTPRLRRKALRTVRFIECGAPLPQTAGSRASREEEADLQTGVLQAREGRAPKLRAQGCITAAGPALTARAGVGQGGEEDTGFGGEFTTCSARTLLRFAASRIHAAARAVSCRLRHTPRHTRGQSSGPVRVNRAPTSSRWNPDANPTQQGQARGNGRGGHGRRLR